MEQNFKLPDLEAFSPLVENVESEQPFEEKEAVSLNKDVDNTAKTAEIAEYRLYDEDYGMSFWKNGEQVAKYSCKDNTIYCTNGNCIPEVANYNKAEQILKEAYDVGDNPFWVGYDDRSGHLEIGGKEVACFDGDTGEVRINGVWYRKTGPDKDNEQMINAIRDRLYERFGIDVTAIPDNSIKASQTIDETAEITTENGKSDKSTKHDTKFAALNFKQEYVSNEGHDGVDGLGS